MGDENPLNNVTTATTGYNDSDYERQAWHCLYKYMYVYMCMCVVVCMTVS